MMRWLAVLVGIAAVWLVARRPAPVAAPKATPPVRSLEATEVDGSPLEVTPELRRFFEYFLSASGEEPDDAIAARVDAAIDAQLHGKAAARAKALFAGFLRMRQAARSMIASGDVDHDLAAIRDLRREIFGEVDAQALFGDIEAEDEAARARRDGKAPPPPAAIPVATWKAEADLRSAGASDEDIRALRLERLGPEATARLEDLDRRRADFAARVSAFRADVQSGGDAETLLAQRFTPEEAVRVRALGRVGSPAQNQPRGSE